MGTKKGTVPDPAVPAAAQPADRFPSAHTTALELRALHALYVYYLRTGDRPEAERFWWETFHFALRHTGRLPGWIRATRSPETIAFYERLFDPAQRDARRSRTLEQVMRLLEHQYARTKNPVYAWDGLALIAPSLPAWLATYVSTAAKQFQALRRDPPAKLDRAITSAVGFPRRGGGDNPFSESAEESHALNIALDVWAAMAGGVKPDFAIDTVVTTHPRVCARQPPCVSISRRTVGRAWEKYRDDIQQP